jgi:MFS family permease
MEKGIRDSLVEQQDDEIPRYDLPLNSSLTYVMFGMTILSIACYTVVAPYMPVVMLEKGVDGPTIGYIFAIFSFAVIVGSPLMGSVI